MEIVITSGQILFFLIACSMFVIGLTAGYFIGKHDGKLETNK
jgi:hypothetical protein